MACECTNPPKKPERGDGAGGAGGAGCDWEAGGAAAGNDKEGWKDSEATTGADEGDGSWDSECSGRCLRWLVEGTLSRRRMESEHGEAVCHA